MNKRFIFLLVKNIYLIEFGFFLKAHDNKCFSEYIKTDLSIVGEVNS